MSMAGGESKVARSTSTTQDSHCNEYGWWYVEGGKINFNYNGYAAYYGVTYRVEGGKVITA